MLESDHVLYHRYGEPEEQGIQESRLPAGSGRKQDADSSTYYIIIDEVQEVEDFVEVLSTLSVTEGADVHVPSPTPGPLSSDVVTEFRSRDDEIHVLAVVVQGIYVRVRGWKEDGWTEYLMYGEQPQLQGKTAMTRKRTSCIACIARYIYGYLRAEQHRVET